MSMYRPSQDFEIYGNDLSSLECRDIRYRYFDVVLDHIQQNIYWMDINGRLVDCNAQQARSFGLEDRCQILGKDIEEIGKIIGWDHELSKSIIANNEYVISSGETLVVEEVIELDGEERFFLSSKSPLRDKEGNVIGIVGISTDITDRKRLERDLINAKEKAEASSKAKSEFIQNISHDLRTPLTGLVTISENYADTLSDNDEHKDAFLIMRDSSNQLHHFLEKIIQSVKLENYTELPKELTIFSIEESINRVFNLFKPALLSKALSYMIQKVEQPIETHLIGYPDLIERILMNLIGNAVKFTDSGGITVSYGLAESTVDQQVTYHLVLMVSDTGKGIDPSKHQAIFERLTRLSPSYKGLYDGHGLGLYITRQLISLMKGQIMVESEGIAGQGSTFICRVPVERSDEQLLSSSVLPVKAVQGTKRVKKDGYHLLLADDSKVARYGAKLTLKNTVPHCTITEAESVQAMTKCIELNEYDLIITDLNFSDGDGKQATQTIRQLNTSKNQKTPIVALTGDLDKVTEQACMTAGIDQVLHKPLTIDAISKMMDEIFTDK